MRHITIEHAQMAKFITVYNAGQLFGLLVIFFCNFNSMSRRLGIHISIICQFIAWIMLIFQSNSTIKVYISRGISGIGGGLALSIAPVYIAEIAPPEIRSGFCSVQKYLLLIGAFIEYALPDGDMHSVASVNAIICGLTIPACWYMPYSPYYLVLVGKVDDAMTALKKLRPASDDVNNEFEMYEMMRHRQKKGGITRVFRAKHGWYLLLSIAVISCGSGYYVVTGYLHVLLYATRWNSTHLVSCRDISEPLKWPDLEYVSDAVLGMENQELTSEMNKVALYLLACLVIATITASILPLNSSRSNLILYSCIFCTLSCLALGTFYFMKFIGYCTEPYVWIAIVAFGIYLFVQTVGITGEYFIFLGEVFPTEVALIGSCLANVIYISLMMLNNTLYNFTVYNVGRWVSFYIFSLFSAWGIYFSQTLVKRRCTRFVELHRGTLRPSRVDNLEKKPRAGIERSRWF